MSFTHALKWSFASELAAKVIQPVVFIVLARLLTPEDFGVMTAAMMVIAFSQIFWEAGMGKALIQRQTDIEEAANAAFFINIALGIVIAGLLYLFAQPIAQTFFQDDRVTAVLQVMTLQVTLGALSSVQTALLQKEMGFKKLFWVRFATVSLPGLASIPLACNGFGYWALVAGTLIGQVAQVITLWKISNWRPGKLFQKIVTKEVATFGAWVCMSGLLVWFYVWMDSLIVGMFLGSHDLGLYRTGTQFSIMVFALIFGPITPVLYSKLSKFGGDKVALSNATSSYIKLITVISMPIAFAVFALNKYIEEYVFGEKWEGVGVVLGVLALAHGISYITSMNTEAYRISGNLLRQVALGRFVMVGKGENRKSIAYVENVAAFIEYCLSFKPGVHVYNFIDKPDFTMNQLVGTVKRILGQSEQIGFRLPYLIGYVIGKGFDLLAAVTGMRPAISSIRVKKFCANSIYNTAIDETGFVPPVPLAQALEQTIRHEFIEKHDDEPLYFSE